MLRAGHLALGIPPAPTFLRLRVRHLRGDSREEQPSSVRLLLFLRNTYVRGKVSFAVSGSFVSGCAFTKWAD